MAVAQATLVLRPHLMASLVLDTSRCKACEYCISACPKKALSLSDKYNQAGYHYIQVDESKCIRCGICYTMCPDSVLQIPTGEVSGI